MEQSSAKISDVFHRISFFSDEFPFSIHRGIRPGRPTSTSRRRFRREFWKIVCVISGRGENIVNDARYPVGPGSIFLVHPDDSTTLNIKTEALEIYNIFFMPELVRDGLRELQDDFDFFSIMHRNSRTKEGDSGSLYVAESDAEMRRLVRTLEPGSSTACRRTTGPGSSSCCSNC